MSERTVEDRFWVKVDRNGPFCRTRPDLGRCWLWTAAVGDDGYGRFGIRRSNGVWRSVVAHRVSYELLVGSIPEGLTLDHLCRVRNCVNPRHAEPVSNGENVLRGVGASAKNARKTHCNRGHPFTAENTYVGPNGARQCRVCMRAKDLRRRTERVCLWCGANFIARHGKSCSKSCAAHTKASGPRVREGMPDVVQFCRQEQSA